MEVSVEPVGSASAQNMARTEMTFSVFLQLFLNIVQVFFIYKMGELEYTVAYYSLGVLFLLANIGAFFFVNVQGSFEKQIHRILLTKHDQVEEGRKWIAAQEMELQAQALADFLAKDHAKSVHTDKVTVDSDESTRSITSSRSHPKVRFARSITQIKKGSDGIDKIEEISDSQKTSQSKDQLEMKPASNLKDIVMRSSSRTRTISETTHEDDFSPELKKIKLDDDRDSVGRGSLNTDSTNPVGSLYDPKIAEMWFKPLMGGYSKDAKIDDAGSDSSIPVRIIKRRVKTPFHVRGFETTPPGATRSGTPGKSPRKSSTPRRRSGTPRKSRTPRKSKTPRKSHSPRGIFSPTRKASGTPRKGGPKMYDSAHNRDRSRKIFAQGPTRAKIIMNTTQGTPTADKSGFFSFSALHGRFRTKGSLMSPQNMPANAHHGRIKSSRSSGPHMDVQHGRFKSSRSSVPLDAQHVRLRSSKSFQAHDAHHGRFGSYPPVQQVADIRFQHSPVDPSDVPESLAHSSDLPVESDVHTISDAPTQTISDLPYDAIEQIISIDENDVPIDPEVERANLHDMDSGSIQSEIPSLPHESLYASYQKMIQHPQQNRTNTRDSNADATSMESFKTGSTRQVSERSSTHGDRTGRRTKSVGANHGRAFRKLPPTSSSFPQDLQPMPSEQNLMSFSSFEELRPIPRASSRPDESFSSFAELRPMPTIQAREMAHQNHARIHSESINRLRPMSTTHQRPRHPSGFPSTANPSMFSARDRLEVDEISHHTGSTLEVPPHIANISYSTINDFNQPQMQPHSSHLATDSNLPTILQDEREGEHRIFEGSVSAMSSTFSSFSTLPPPSFQGSMSEHELQYGPTPARMDSPLPQDTVPLSAAPTPAPFEAPLPTYSESSSWYSMRSRTFARTAVTFETKEGAYTSEEGTSASHTFAGSYSSQHKSDTSIEPRARVIKRMIAGSESHLDPRVRTIQRGDSASESSQSSAMRVIRREDTPSQQTQEVYSPILKVLDWEDSESNIRHIYRAESEATTFPDSTRSFTRATGRSDTRATTAYSDTRATSAYSDTRLTGYSYTKATGYSSLAPTQRTGPSYADTYGADTESTFSSARNTYAITETFTHLNTMNTLPRYSTSDDTGGEHYSIAESTVSSSLAPTQTIYRVYEDGEASSRYAASEASSYYPARMILRAGESDTTSFLGETETSVIEPFTDGATSDAPESGFLSTVGDADIAAKAESATTDDSKSETSEVQDPEFVGLPDHMKISLPTEIFLHFIGCGLLVRAMKDWNKFQLSPLFHFYRWVQLFLQNLPCLSMVMLWCFHDDNLNFKNFGLVICSFVLVGFSGMSSFRALDYRYEDIDFMIFVYFIMDVIIRVLPIIMYIHEKSELGVIFVVASFLIEVHSFGYLFGNITPLTTVFSFIGVFSSLLLWQISFAKMLNWGTIEGILGLNHIFHCLTAGLCMVVLFHKNLSPMWLPLLSSCIVVSTIVLRFLLRHIERDFVQSQYDLNIMRYAAQKFNVKYTKKEDAKEAKEKFRVIWSYLKFRMLNESEYFVQNEDGTENFFQMIFQYPAGIVFTHSHLKELVVYRIIKNSPAEKMNLKRGDVVEAINHHTVTNSELDIRHLWEEDAPALLYMHRYKITKRCELCRFPLKDDWEYCPGCAAHLESSLTRRDRFIINTAVLVWSFSDHQWLEGQILDAEDDDEVICVKFKTLSNINITKNVNRYRDDLVRPYQRQDRNSQATGTWRHRLDQFAIQVEKYFTIPTVPDRIFKLIDVNHDGRLDHWEFVDRCAELEIETNADKLFYRLKPKHKKYITVLDIENFMAHGGEKDKKLLNKFIDEVATAEANLKKVLSTEERIVQEEKRPSDVVRKQSLIEHDPRRHDVSKTGDLDYEEDSIILDSDEEHELFMFRQFSSNSTRARGQNVMELPEELENDDDVQKSDKNSRSASRSMSIFQDEEKSKDSNASELSFGKVKTKSNPSLLHSTTDQIFEDFLEETRNANLIFSKADSEHSFSFSRAGSTLTPSIDMPSMPSFFRKKQSEMQSHQTLREVIAPFMTRSARTLDGFYRDGFDFESEYTESEYDSNPMTIPKQGTQRVEASEVVDMFYGRGNYDTIRTQLSKISVANSELTVSIEKAASERKLSESKASLGSFKSSADSPVASEIVSNQEKQRFSFTASPSRKSLSKISVASVEESVTVPKIARQESIKWSDDSDDVIEISSISTEFEQPPMEIRLIPATPSNREVVLVRSNSLEV